MSKTPATAGVLLANVESRVNFCLNDFTCRSKEDRMLTISARELKPNGLSGVWK